MYVMNALNIPSDFATLDWFSALSSAQPRGLVVRLPVCPQASRRQPPPSCVGRGLAREGEGGGEGVGGKLRRSAASAWGQRRSSAGERRKSRALIFLAQIACNFFGASRMHFFFSGGRRLRAEELGARGSARPATRRSRPRNTTAKGLAWANTNADAGPCVRGPPPPPCLWRTDTCDRG